MKSLHIYFLKIEKKIEEKNMGTNKNEIFEFRNMIEVIAQKHVLQTLRPLNTDCFRKETRFWPNVENTNAIDPDDINKNNENSKSMKVIDVSINDL